MKFLTDWISLVLADRGQPHGNTDPSQPLAKASAFAAPGNLGGGGNSTFEKKGAAAVSLFARMEKLSIAGDLAERSHHHPAIAYAENPVVHRAVRLIAEAAASIPLLVYDGVHELDTHPALDLLSRPNERDSGTVLREEIFAGLMIAGNAYLHLVTLEGKPRELYLLDPARVDVVTDASGWPVAYDYGMASTRRRYVIDPLAPQILHLKTANPLNPVKGLAPVEAARLALGIHDAASQWNRALLENSARPSGALVYSGGEGAGLSDDQFQRLRAELDDGFSGAASAGRPMLLEGGLDWKAMGYSPKDMDFIEAKNIAAREIALAFGVPPMLLGIAGDNTYANYREANRAFWHQNILPLARKVADALGYFLSRHFGEEISLMLDTDRVEALAEERDSAWQRIEAATFLTLNEKREALGYSPLPGLAGFANGATIPNPDLTEFAHQGELA